MKVLPNIPLTSEFSRFLIETHFYLEKDTKIVERNKQTQKVLETNQKL